MAIDLARTVIAENRLNQLAIVREDRLHFTIPTDRDDLRAGKLDFVGGEAPHILRLAGYQQQAIVADPIEIADFRIAHPPAIDNRLVLIEEDELTHPADAGEDGDVPSARRDSRILDIGQVAVDGKGQRPLSMKLAERENEQQCREQRPNFSGVWHGSPLNPAIGQALPTERVKTSR